jgi:glycerate kinase
LKIAVAPNAFKGTLTAAEAALCIERGLASVLDSVTVARIPMADGVDGTAAAIVAATQGRMVKSTVHDPLGRPIKAAWGLAGDGRTAVIEMAAASGLALLRRDEYNPLAASTHAIERLRFIGHTSSWSMSTGFFLPLLNCERFIPRLLWLQEPGEPG